MTVEGLLVGIIVAGCAGFSAWRLMSIRLRLKVLDVLPSMLPGVAHMRRKTWARLAGGGCASCEARVVSGSARPANQKPAAPRH